MCDDQCEQMLGRIEDHDLAGAVRDVLEAIDAEHSPAA